MRQISDMRMGIRRPVYACLAAALLAMSSRLPAPVPPGMTYVLINNTSRIVECSAGASGAGWSPAFSLRPGTQWDSSDYDHHDYIFLHCRPPVRQRAFSLCGGHRYSILQSRNGVEADVVEVTASEGDRLPACLAGALR